jgi:hypothetical protein
VNLQASGAPSSFLLTESLRQQMQDPRSELRQSEL